jgi:hypothetical protein
VCVMMAGELGAGERDRLVVRVASLESEAATEVADARQSGGERKLEPWCTVEEARSFFWFTVLLLVSGVVLRAVDDAHDECFGVDCGPHGSCGGGACECEGGYGGESCQTHDECFGVDCGPHGSCGGGACECEVGYSGESCQTYDECFGVDCGPHGSCGGGVCECAGGYSGESCQTYDECFGVDCGPHGSCGGGVCECEGGYVGESCQADDAHRVMAFGWNRHGGLGPVEVTALGGENVAVSAGVAHSLVLTGDGRVMAFGSNDYGRLGDGTTTDRHSPVELTALGGENVAVSAGRFHSLVLM